ncbi:unnamed protein product [Discosporangium mesarthrocarpum]
MTVLSAALGDLHLETYQDMRYGDVVYILLASVTLMTTITLAVVVIFTMASMLGLGLGSRGERSHLQHQFHLSRARMLMGASDGCSRDKLPPPINLLQLVAKGLASLSGLLSPGGRPEYRPEPPPGAGEAPPVKPSAITEEKKTPATGSGMRAGGKIRVRARVRARDGAGKVVGRLFFWLVMGGLGLVGAVALNWIFLPRFLWPSGGHVGSRPRDKWKAFKAVVRAVLWGLVAVPCRLVALWLLSLGLVWAGDKEQESLWEATKTAVTEGRKGGDFRLAQVLHQQLCMNGRDADLPEGLTMGDLKKPLEKPLEVDPGLSQRDLYQQCSLKHIKLLAQSTRAGQYQLEDRLKSLEASVSQVLKHMESRRSGFDHGAEAVSGGLSRLVQVPERAPSK